MSTYTLHKCNSITKQKFVAICAFSISDLSISHWTKWQRTYFEEKKNILLFAAAIHNQSPICKSFQNIFLKHSVFTNFLLIQLLNKLGITLFYVDGKEKLWSKRKTPVLMIFSYDYVEIAN